MQQRLSGKLAVVTGASRGIGFAIAEQLAAEGANLVLIARDRHALALAAAALPGLPLLIAADLSTEAGVDDVIGRLEQIGRPVDVFVNNAGTGVGGDFAETGWSTIDQMLELNVGGLVRLTHWVARGMAARKAGRILNVSSVVASQPVPQLALYAATKAFVSSLSIAMSHELRPFGVTVTAVHPGATATAFAGQAGIDRSLALRLFGTIAPARVARAAVNGMLAGRFRVLPGVWAKLIWFAADLTPTTVGLAVMSLLFRQPKPRLIRATGLPVAAE